MNYLPETDAWKANNSGPSKRPCGTTPCVQDLFIKWVREVSLKKEKVTRKESSQLDIIPYKDFEQDVFRCLF